MKTVEIFETITLNRWNERLRRPVPIHVAADVATDVAADVVAAARRPGRWLGRARAALRAGSSRVPGFHRGMPIGRGVLLGQAVPAQSMMTGVLAGMGAGAGVGASLMYLFDPTRGRRRRNALRDKLRHYLLHYLRKTGRAYTTTTRNLGNHMQGAIARRRSGVTYDGPIDDDILAARVRAAMGHAVRHPRMVSVAADHGRIVLSGAIRADGVAELRPRIAAVPGVTQVEDHLVVR